MCWHCSSLLQGQRSVSRGQTSSLQSIKLNLIHPSPSICYHSQLKAQRAATALLSSKGKDLLAGVKASDAKEAEAILESVRTKVSELGAAVEAEDRQAAVKAQVTALRSLDRLGTLEVRKSTYPTYQFR